MEKDKLPNKSSIKIAVSSVIRITHVKQVSCTNFAHDFFVYSFFERCLKKTTLTQKIAIFGLYRLSIKATHPTKQTSYEQYSAYVGKRIRKMRYTCQSLRRTTVTARATQVQFIGQERDFYLPSTHVCTFWSCNSYKTISEQ